MKRLIFSILLVSFWVASPVYADPLTWLFSGTADASSTDKDGSIEGLSFELRIFLNTDLVGMKFPGLADVFFGSAVPFHGEVSIEGRGVLPVNDFVNVQNFGLGTSVTGVQFRQLESGVGLSGILFDGPISNDNLHLTPIGSSHPSIDKTLFFVGPDGLSVSGEVATFTAVGPLGVPESSSALLLTSGLAAIGFLLRRIRREPCV